MSDQAINTDSQKKVPATEEQVEVILHLLQQVVNHFKLDVDTSKELFSLGAKTKLASNIEESIKDPLKNMFSTAKNLDNIINDFIDKTLIQNFLKSRSDILESAYKMNQFDPNLFYLIVLKQDNENNRDLIFDFFDKYDYLEVSKKYPVYFQFVSNEFAEELNNKVLKISL